MRKYDSSDALCTCALTSIVADGTKDLSGAHEDLELGPDRFEHALTLFLSIIGATYAGDVTKANQICGNGIDAPYAVSSPPHINKPHFVEFRKRPVTWLHDIQVITQLSKPLSSYPLTISCLELEIC